MCVCVYVLCVLTCVCVCVDDRLMPGKGHLTLFLAYCLSLKQTEKKKKDERLPHKGLQMNQETLH